MAAAIVVQAPAKLARALAQAKQRAREKRPQEEKRTNEAGPRVETNQPANHWSEDGDA